DLSAESVRFGNVLLRSRRQCPAERALDLLQRFIGSSERDESLGDIRGHVDRPTPPVSPEPRLGTPLRLLQLRKRLGRLAQVEMVESFVDQRADLDVAVLDLLADVGAQLVMPERARKISELLVDPADRVLEPTDEELVVAITRFREALLDE